ncbi:MAG: hypothetical protein WCF37_20000, partial [Pseudolabrys sp.]
MAEYVTVEQFVEHVEGNTETLKALLGLANSAYAMRGQIAALTCACSVAFRRIGAVEQSRAGLELAIAEIEEVTATIQADPGISPDFLVGMR